MESFSSLMESFSCTRVVMAETQKVAFQCEHAAATAVRCLSGHGMSGQCPEGPRLCRDAYRAGELEIPPHMPERYPLAGLAALEEEEEAGHNIGAGADCPLARAAARADLHPRQRKEREKARKLLSLQRAVGQTLKQCPFCGNACAKEDAAHGDRIMCTCGREFCWECLVDREVILHHGNQYHRPDCKYYSEFKQSEPEYRPACPQCRLNGHACRPVRAPMNRVGRGVRSGSIGGS